MFSLLASLPERTERGYAGKSLAKQELSKFLPQKGAAGNLLSKFWQELGKSVSQRSGLNKELNKNWTKSLPHAHAELGLNHGLRSSPVESRG